MAAGRTRDGKFLVWNPPATPPPNPACSRRSAQRQLPAHQRPPQTITSTPSITATASGTSAPTTAAATSASSLRPSPRPAATTGPNAFLIATTSCSKRSISSPIFHRLRARRRPASPAPLDFPDHGPEAAKTAEIAFPEPAYSAHPHINRIFETTTFRYGYQSLVTPSSVYEYDVPTGASTLLKQLEIPGGFDRTLYASERVHAAAPDGVPVPVSLVYRKDKRQPGRNPLYVYGYGSYGYSLPLGFSSNVSACSIAA